VGSLTNHRNATRDDLGQTGYNDDPGAPKTRQTGRQGKGNRETVAQSDDDVPDDRGVDQLSLVGPTQFAAADLLWTVVLVTYRTVYTRAKYSQHQARIRQFSELWPNAGNKISRRDNARQRSFTVAGGSNAPHRRSRERLSISGSPCRKQNRALVGSRRRAVRRSSHVAGSVRREVATRKLRVEPESGLGNGREADPGVVAVQGLKTREGSTSDL
jgi:hypothetical protein